MRMLVVSEGKLDVGHGGELGSVTVLVRKVVESALGRELHDAEIEATTIRSQKLELGKGMETRLRTALRAAEANRRGSVAFVIDRDGPKNTGRRAALEDARRKMEEGGGTLATLAAHTALGVAVETVEAWLLADEGALNRALAPTQPINRFKDPETYTGGPRDDTHPKNVLADHCIIHATHERDTRGHYVAIAQEARLELIEERCPNGFAPFARELRARVR